MDKKIYIEFMFKSEYTDEQIELLMSSFMKSFPLKGNGSETITNVEINCEVL